MATIGEAHIYLAEEFEVPVAAVKNIGLRLLDHGLRDKSPRGAGAAQITAKDLTYHAIPLICGIGPKETPHVMGALGDLDLIGAEVWKVDPDIGFMLGQGSVDLTASQLLTLNGGGFASIEVNQLLQRLPLAAKFDDTFAAILEKLAGPDDPLLEFLEVDIFPTRPAAGIRARVAPSEGGSGSVFYNVSFSGPMEKRSKRRDRAINQVPKELLVDLAKLIAPSKD